MNPLNKKRLRNKEYQRLRRLSPSFREKQRLYFRQRRLSPAYREKQRIYSKEYKARPEFKIKQRLYNNKVRKKKRVAVNSQKRSSCLEALVDSIFKCELVLE